MGRRLGLDSIAFDTFGWPLVWTSRRSRAWVSDDVSLSVHFLKEPPDIPSLRVEEIRQSFEAAMGIAPNDVTLPGERTARLIDVEVTTGGVVPIVLAIMRSPLEDRYTFRAVLRLPLADCGWALIVTAEEGEITGLREAAAMDTWLQEVGLDSLDEFDAYDRRWDDPDLSAFGSGLVDPLTVVRDHIERVRASLTFSPSVADYPAFTG